jgi:hypothetical protein
MNCYLLGKKWVSGIPRTQSGKLLSLKRKSAVTVSKILSFSISTMNLFLKVIHLMNSQEKVKLNKTTHNYQLRDSLEITFRLLAFLLV